VKKLTERIAVRPQFLSKRLIHDDGTEIQRFIEFLLTCKKGFAIL